MKEVERVDRQAAKIAIETERLKRLRDEAMEIVRRVEPGLMESPPPSRPLSSRSMTQDDMLFLNKDLKHVRDLILSENLHDEEGPKLTDMFSGKNPQLRRHGSYGSLIHTSPGGSVPPPMPLMNNYYGYYPPPHEMMDGGYPPYEERYGYYPYMYGNMPPHPNTPPQMYHHDPCRKMSHSQMKKMHGHHHRNQHRYRDRDMSSEGENTSNDACDLSSSEASGSGRRRKNKSVSPKPPMMPRYERVVPKSRKSRSKSPEKRQERDEVPEPPRKSSSNIQRQEIDVNDKPEKTSVPETPEKKSIVESPEKISEHIKENIESRLQDNRPDENSELAVRNNDEKESVPQKTLKTSEKQVIIEPERPKSELRRIESEQKFVIDSPDEDNEDGKLYSSETDSSVKDVQPQKSPIRRASVDRERKVGLGLHQNPVETSAYQQMLHGGLKKQEIVPSADDETSSDDIEAQLAIGNISTKPRTKFMASSLHNEDASLNDSPPAPTKKLTQAEPLRMSGLGGHPMPLSFGIPGIAGAGSAPGVLAGGKLGHPLAQRVGMMALANNDSVQQQNDAGGNMSAPDNDSDEDFWS